MGAQIVSSTPESVYATSGRNYAPLTPLEQFGKPQYDKSNFCDAIKKKYDDYKARDYQAWQDSVDIGRMVANLRTGKLLLLRNALDNRYLFVKRDGKYSDNKTVGGLFQFYSTKLTAEWLSSRPERDPVLPSDDDQIVEYIRDVKIIQDSYDKKFFDDKYETLESISAQDYGTWITRFRFDPEKKDIVCELLPYPACRWDIRFTPEESDYFIYESRESTAVLKHLLHADIMADDDFPNQYGLQIIEQIARQGGNAQGYGKERAMGEYDTVRGETTVSQMWLQPEAYADIELRGEEGTICGYPLGNLLEMFPAGMCIVGINGMNTIIGVYAENHREHIVSGYYHIQSFSGIGKGVSDAVDVKKEMDDLHSQVMSYIKAHGTPAWAYNQSLISEEQARNIGKPRKNIAIDFSNAPDGVTNVNQVIQALIPGNPAGSVFQYQQTLENFLQMSFQVTTFSDGMPGVNNTTATGAQIGESNERMMLVPQHRNKADHRKRADKVIFNLFKKYIDKAKFFATRDKNSITAGKYLSGTQFDGVDVDFEIIADSEIPKSRFTKEMALTKLLNFSGGIQGLIQSNQLDPELTSAVVQAFGVDLPISKPVDVARNCRRIVEQAKALLDQELQAQRMIGAITGQVPDNSQLAQSIVANLVPPISPAEPFIQQKVMWFSQLLDTDEMVYTNPQMRSIIEHIILAYVSSEALGQGLIQQAAAEGQMMGAQPMMQAAQQQQQAQADQEMQMQQAQAEAQAQNAERQAVAQSQGQLQLKAAEHQMNQQQSQQQFDQDVAKADLQHEQNMQIKEMELQAKKEEAKKRPYPSGAKK